MKNLFLNTLAALATLAVTAPLGLAQSTLSATVPFAFAIDNRHVLPAGDYVVVKVDGRWQFRSQEGKGSAFTTGSPQISRKTDPSRLVFDCRGNRCSLREVQAGYGELGYYIPPPRLRKADALELARVVVVPLNGSERN